MSGRPDGAAARWADDGVEGAEEAPAADVDAPEADAGAAGGEPGAAADAAAGAAEAGAGAAEDGAPVEDGSPILTDVAALTAQRDEYLESLQRLKADFDNYRKRVTRLQAEQSARAEANLVAKLLPVLDNLDLAWAHLGPREGEEAAGSEEARAIAQARSQLLDVLGKEGLERVDAVDVPFDPTEHDAVAHAEPDPDAAPSGDAPQKPDEGEGGGNGAAQHTVVVDDVLRAGYRWHGQVLRPAMVRVRG